MGYEKKFNNSIDEERIILIEKDISCSALMKKCEETLKKQKFIGIKKQEMINIIEAQYKSGFRYGILKIRIQDVLGKKRLYLKVTSDNNFWVEIFNLKVSGYIIDKFLEKIDLEYSEI